MADRWVSLRTPLRSGVVHLELTEGARVEDLAGALGAPGAPVRVDGRPAAPGARLVDALLPAAEVRVGPGAPDEPPDDAPTDPPTPAAPPGRQLVATGGLWAGRAVPLVAGSVVVVGRAPGCDLRLPCPTVSPRHLEVEASSSTVRVRDLGSRNGTWGPAGQPDPPRAEVELRVGANRLRVLPAEAPDLDRLGTPDPESGRRAFDRGLAPPRAEEPVPIRRPPAGEEPPSPPAFNWTLVLGPLAMAVVLALVLSPALAALALLSPVLAGSSWLEGRWTHRRRRRRAAVERTAALGAFQDAVRAQQVLVAAARHAAHPDPAAVAARARRADRRLWHRRPGHQQWLALRVGTGSVPWTPVVGGTGPLPADVQVVLAAHRTLTEVPVTLDASAGSVVAVVGHPRLTAAVARALLLDAAVHHGPADLRLAVDSDREEDWAWARWLPHHVDAWGADRGAGDGGEGRHLLVLTDRPHPLRPGTATRAALDRPGTPAAVIVLTDDPAAVPDRCGAVVTARDDLGRASLEQAAGGAAPSELRLDGLPVEVAEQAARALARLHDPEDRAGGALPSTVRLADVAPWPASVDDLQRRWDRCRPGRLTATIGAAADGPCTVDLVTDGPHALVAGTTGAGKSELLRTLVASLACAHPPDQVTFVLVDFKGGSAFDACAELPHTVGVVTDLDDRLGERAVRSLEAELRRRERRLRATGCRDLAEHQATTAAGDGPPLAHLVLVVDEFATLARQLPDVLTGLVDLAQRGRSLGVHVVLATQRPAGVVSDQIRANTDLRIALRVVDDADSVDVVGDRAATALPADRPGRAIVQRAGRRTVVQVADASGAPVARPPVRIRWLDGAAEPGLDEQDDSTTEPERNGPTNRTELDVLAERATAAWGRRLAARPRLAEARHRPWLAPLPTRLPWRDLAAAAGGSPGWPLALADDPDQQRRVPLAWDPADGPLLLYGQRGSGCTTALQTAVVAGCHTGRDVHAYAVTASPGEWARVAHLPGVGAVIDVRDLDHLQRLVDLVLDESRSEGCLTLVAVDEVRPFLDAVDALGGVRAVDAVLNRLAGGRGLAVAVSSERVSAVPGGLAAVAAHRWCFRLPDAYDYPGFGLPPTDPRHLPPGRGLSAETGLELQVAWPEPPDAGPGAPGAPSRPPPDPLEPLPTDVRTHDLGGAGFVVGLGDHPRAPVAWPLSAGDHVLVTGPNGSGRSTLLAAVAGAHRRGVLPCGRLVVTGAPRSPLRTDPATADSWLPAEDAWRTAVAVDGPVTVLVDDAELAPDPPPDAVARLTSEQVLLVVAVHPERLRATYQHWTAPLRRARYGLALLPHRSDGELWATALPRGCTAGWPPGRGYLLDHGTARLLQVARP